MADNAKLDGTLAGLLLDVLRLMQAASEAVRQENARLDREIAAEVARQRGDKPLH